MIENFECLPENAGYILLAVVTMTTDNRCIMTTDNEMHPTFPECIRFFIISVLYRVFVEIVEVHSITDIARIILKP